MSPFSAVVRTGGSLRASGRIYFDSIPEPSAIVASHNPTVFLPLSNKRPNCTLNCRACHTLITTNAIHAVLLNNVRTEIYATGSAPIGAEGIGASYSTKSCPCRLTDFACLNCGNVLGTVLSFMCESCVSEHPWRYHKEAVTANDLVDFSCATTGLRINLTPEAEPSMLHIQEFPGR
ncbi:hypothetical protein K493DRAFT_262033 [Basidiobolus meristosporus CBS 931.73]|uniref:Protein FAM72 n=1 Tax=Basidiobolus meristosporus CBS 931.73 TaxID=1314790 RepID=A0A1Y1Y7W9_9FUNG|nr:hypothetical protein K493DRAFT_262033 [Basidiobolus meristosporus CBS 931.73]|eukprot:ORX93826.1 hypothetical protein K493DRAFT_262033 [Basidiobolus meristosporus CBS 931.73]